MVYAPSNLKISFFIFKIIFLKFREIVYPVFDCKDLERKMCR